MASATRHLCRSLFQVTRRAPGKRKSHQPRFAPHIPTVRQFSIAAAHRADAPRSDNPQQTSRAAAVIDEIEKASLPDPSDYLTPAIPITVKDLDPQERADYEVLSKNEQAKFLALQNHYKAVAESGVDDETMNKLASDIVREMQREGDNMDFPFTRPRGREIGFWGMDEEDEIGQVEDGDDEVSPDLITSVAESELELKREIREYTRVVAWDMPLLSEFAKPFKVPDHTTPLRFRYTTYMGEAHPAAKKVVVQFCTKELPGLTEQQRVKLVKLLGVRYNPDLDLVKMSCEKYEAPAQNKRYLGDLVNKLIAEAKTGDTFEDVPLDFRHHKPKKQHLFPEEWKLTPKTVQKVLEQREQGKLLLDEGEAPLDGREVVNEYVLMRSTSNQQPQPRGRPMPGLR